MPKPKVSTSTNAPTPSAAALISDAVARGTAAAPVPEAARVELEKILAHNDTQAPTSRARVNQDAALDLMQKLGWSVKSHHTLNAYCRRVLGRRSYATA